MTQSENNQLESECGKSTKGNGPRLDSDSRKLCPKRYLRQEGTFKHGLGIR